MKTIIVQSVLLLLAGSSVIAGPPIWEADYGQLVPPADSLDLSSLAGLRNEDDANSEVTLGFTFPFKGIGYTNVWVSTNGCIQLGTLGFDGNLDYDLWQSFEEFYDDGDETGDPEPVICPFNSDLDNTTDGAVWFNDTGDRVVFTWDEVGTNFEETHHLSFQAQLLANGTIIFGYNGVLDDEGEAVAASTEGGSLDEGIVIGISLSEGTYPTPSIDFDLNGPAFSAGDTIFERWCYDAANSCGEDLRNLGYTGGPNFRWDLEAQNVIFTPREGGGFDVRSEGNAPLPSRRRTVSRPSSGENAQMVSISENFRFGTRGWVPVSGGAARKRALLPEAGPRPLPARVGIQGYRMMLHGPADGISTFMSKRIGESAGLVPNQTYVADVSIVVLGAGEETVSAGVSEREPFRISTEEDTAHIVDRNDRPSARTTSHHRSLVTTGDTSDLRLFIGTVPGTGEETVVYIDSISVTLIPVPQD